MDGAVVVSAEFARQLERELSQVKTRLAQETNFKYNANRRADYAEAELAKLKRGEFICKRCGLRKDAEFERGNF
jgi:hypothetical protein